MAIQRTYLLHLFCRKVQFSRWSNIFIMLSLNLMLFLFVGGVYGQASQISPEWKAHFTATPVISNCVYEDKLAELNGETLLFQFRWQTNAFLFRQIENLAEASSNHISEIVKPVVLNGYVGRFERDSWSIEWTDDPYGTLWLFPNAGNIWDTPPSAQEFDLYIGKANLSTVLYYGINSGINPASVEWEDDTNFTALLFKNGKKIVVNITGVSNGLPTGLEWHTTNAPVGFSVEYKYENQGFDLPYFPSEIRTFMKDDNGKRLVEVVKILILKTSPTQLAKNVFDPETYYVTPPASRLKPAILLFTNGQEFSMNDGHLQNVLSASDVKLPGSFGSHTISVKLIRLLFLSFLVLSVIGFLFILKHAKQINK